MKKEHFFGKAIWLGSAERRHDTFSVLYGEFYAKESSTVLLNALGLGFFKCYINGCCINPDSFLPLSSEYDSVAPPKDEVLSGKRIYVPSFDISRWVKSGKNIIAIHFGGGWYCANSRKFGLPKAIYRVQVESEGKTEFYYSDESCKIGPSFVSDYYFVYEECHDYSLCAPCYDKIPEECESAVATEGLDTEYEITDCPVDTLISSITPKRVSVTQNGAVYDVGRNITGYPVLKIPQNAADEIEVKFSEEITKDGELDPSHMHKQRFKVTSDGAERIVKAEFTWFGFRYFEINGHAEPISVSEVHADVKRSSDFSCSSETLNWIYEAFVHTMLSNMHTGHPSDCPHLERRGYTGDGQLTSHAAFTTLGAEAFYKKWLRDIADGQDIISGHIQNAAPYVRSGGGPGGWGSAIIEIPYQIYMHYGDVSVLKQYYGNMRRYIDYLDAHTEFGLVTTDKVGEWCLGEWCAPIILYPEKDITTHNQQTFIPAAMVNTYFAIKSLNRLSEIARIIGRCDDADEYLSKAELRKKAVTAAYFNAIDGNFLMNVQGANAFAVDLGLGNEKTYRNMVDYYRKLGHYDTGIFATDILTRLLFERGDVDLAIELLTGDGPQGFENWRRCGATTFREYWDNEKSRSHNHPMFGAVTAYLFEFVLGIRQQPGTAGYSSLIIEPLATDKIKYASGSMEAPHGAVGVEYRRIDGGLSAKIRIPKDTEACFKYNDRTVNLSHGDNFLELKA